MMVSESTYFKKPGTLYPYDIRYDPNDRAFCDPLGGGEVLFRLWTEPGFPEAVLVYNDGTPQAATMTKEAEDRRFSYWQVQIAPAAPQFRYSFALLTGDGRAIYLTEHGIDHSVESTDHWTLDLAQAVPHITPEWARGAVIYQIFPDRFHNGDRANDPPGTVAWGAQPKWLEFQGGDLQGIAGKADYLADLGVDIVYLTPIFTSPSTHKYDTIDYRHVDPGFGGDDALRGLVDALHRRGMKLLLDASFNHCSPRFFAFQDIVANGEKSRYRDWFTVTDWPVRVKYRPHLAPPSSDPLALAYRDWMLNFPQRSGVPFEQVEASGTGDRVLEPTYLAWSGVLDMPKLNQNNPETRAYFMDVAQYWLREFDVDGWRMDVARHIVPDFWNDFRVACRVARPDAYLIAEIWGDTSRWLQGDRFDATMNYFFRDLCVGWFASGNLSTEDFVQGIHRMLAMYSPQVTAVNHNLFSSHDVPRFRHEAGGDAGALRRATVFQLTMPGSPGIYYGDEIGMTGGADPDCRRAFPWDTPEAWDGQMLETVRSLTRLRKAHRALQLGSIRFVKQEAGEIVYERRHEGERVVVAINRAGKAVTTPHGVELWRSQTGDAVVMGM